MLVFSAIALESLLEPRIKVSNKEPLNLNPVTDTQTEAVSEPPAASRHIYISPARYKTPVPASIPDNLFEPLSPSPYVVNHKRRGGRAGAGVGRRRTDGFEFGDGEQNKGSGLNELKEVVEENFGDVNLFEDSENPYVEEDGFLDFECESASVGSADEIRQLDCQSFVSAQEEFSDANEDFSSDDSVVNSTSYSQRVESELRLGLLEEIERRKNAEEALDLMQSHWQRFNNILSKSGLTSLASSISGKMPYENASIEEVCQEGIVTMFVAEPAKLAAEFILECKD